MGDFILGIICFFSGVGARTVVDFCEKIWEERNHRCDTNT